MKENNIEENEIRYIPTNDYVFKRIFGYKGNEDITADLLKAVTGVEYKDVILTNKLEIIIIELEKLEENINKKGEDKKLLNWCRFIKAPEEVEDSIMNENENIKRAKEELDKINQDERERMLAELREKAIMDELAIRASGYKEGKEEGIIEGQEKGILKTEKKYVRKMLERKMSIDDIIEITGLTKDEINTIIN